MLYKGRSLYNANGLPLQDGEVVKRAMHNSPLDLGAINDYFNTYELDVAISFHLNTRWLLTATLGVYH